MSARRRPSRPGPRRVLAVVGIVLFVLVDAALIGYALTSSQVPPSTRTPAPLPTFITPRSPSPAPSPTPSAAAAAQPAIELAFLAPVDEEVAWRATPGSCTGPDPVIERTTDGGATWQAVGPVDLGVHEVLALSAVDDTTARIVARVGEACGTAALATFTEGDFWKEYPDTLTDFAFADPATGTTVQVDGAAVAAPCVQVLQVLQRSDSTAAVCEDALLELAPGSAAWLSMTVPHLGAVAASEAGYTLARPGLGDCVGLAIEAIPSPLGSAGPTRVGCLAQAVGASALAIAQAGSAVWVWADGEVWVSRDGGAGWGE